MTRTPVTSSTIAEIGYDRATRTLEILFKRGGVYQYQDVPAEDHDRLMIADSKGVFLSECIRPYFAAKKVS